MVLETGTVKPNPGITSRSPEHFRLPAAPLGDLQDKTVVFCRTWADAQVDFPDPSVSFFCYILEYLAGEDSVEDLLQEFKDLERDDILACLAYAARSLDFKEFKVPA